MSFSRVFNQVHLGHASTFFLNVWNAPKLHRKIERCCTANLQKTKATTLIEMFILSHKSLGINPWHFATSARKWVQVQHHAVASATQQWKKRSHQNVSSSQTWQWRIVHLFSQRTKPPFWAGDFPAVHGHDDRSVATGFHSPWLPFLAPRYSQRSHVPDRVCGARSENNALPNATVRGKMRQPIMSMLAALSI